MTKFDSKITKKQLFTAVYRILCNYFADASEGDTLTPKLFDGVEGVTGCDILAGIEHEIHLLDTKAAKAKNASSKKSMEQEAVMSQITNFIAESGSERLTATEIANGVGVSTQKASALLKKLGESGLVVKTVEGKKSYFALADFFDSEV